ncbi:MAG: recombination-associated protein RdgC [Lysobacteraceae bacterium]|nr:MAG: recombination-associated protein RdgC [Xanthomonadaceae bacterium]
MAFFKNLWIYELTEPFRFTADELEAALAAKELGQCGALERSTFGFSSPFGRDSDVFVHAVEGRLLFRFSVAERVLPASVVNDEVADRLSRQDEQPVRAAKRREVKDQVLLELLPKAFVRQKHIAAYIDPEVGILVIDTSSDKAADELQSALRDALGSLPLRIPDRPGSAARMSAWVAGERPLPANMALADECELRDRSDRTSVVRCRGQNLESAEIRSHIRAGMEVSLLKVEWAERLVFVLTSEMGVRRLRVTDLVIDQFPETSDDLRAEMDAMFLLMAGEFKQLWGDINRWFGDD